MIHGVTRCPTRASDCFFAPRPCEYTSEVARA